MMRITVQVTNMSGERFWAHDSPLPAQVQIAVNINIVGFDRKNDQTAEAPFVFTVNYTPAVAQLSVKGRAQVSGDVPEIQKIIEDHQQNKPPPGLIVQAISSIAMAETILLSKSLGIPPPLPPIGVPQEQQVQQSQSQSRRPETRYT